jgi:hypothetical protein
MMLAMRSTLARFRPIGRVALIALGVMLAGSPSRAQDKTPVPAFNGNRVYVAGVPDRYQSLAGQIVDLEKSSRQTYYVVVVKSTGKNAADYVDSVYETWRDQATARRLSLDPERSVVVVMGFEPRRIALHPGSKIRDLGLHGDAIERDLVGPSSSFVRFARQDKYPEAIAVLLQETDRWIGAREVTAKPAPEVKTSAAPPVSAAVPGTISPGMGTLKVNGPERSPGREVIVGIGLSLIAVVLAVVGLIWVAHRRLKSRVTQRFKEVRSKATDVMDRLDALKERLKLLPATDPDFQAPLTGETQALSDAVQGELTKLWDRWLQVMDAVDRAEKLAKSVSSPFQRKKLGDAESLLEQNRAFAEIETGAQACTADMDRLNHAHESARGLLQAIGEAKNRLAAQLETVRKLGLPLAPYEEDQAAIGTGTDQASARLTADPIGAGSALEALRSRAEGLLGRLEHIAKLFQDAQQASTALEGLKQQVAHHRAQGLRLVEEGGDPDPLLEQGNQAHSQSLAALQTGNPDEAAQALEAARSMVEQGRTVIEQVQKAKAYCEREQPGRTRETERLRAAIPQAESYHQELQRGFAPGSWQAVARNLDQTRGLVATFDRLAADAAAMASAGSQKYLAGARRLEQLAQQQQIVLRLMSGLGEQLNLLSAARGECQKRRGELEALDRRVEGYFRQHDAVVGEMARGSLDSALRAREDVLAGFGESRPDWPAVGRALAQALEELAIAQSQAESDVKSYDQLRDAYDRARQELERVAGLLSSRREDRVAANQRFRAAAEVLDYVGLDLSSPRGEWARLLTSVRDAGNDLEQAERLAREDIRLAGQAEAEIAEAARAIQQAQGYFAMDVTVDTTGANAALERAQRLLEAQEYEQAIQCAGGAVQQVRQAHQAAVQQASWREMQADADRRRWQAGNGGSPMGPLLSAGATAAAVAAGVILDRVVQAASASSPPAEPPSIPQPSSDTGVGTWSSDSGQGTW